MAIVNCTARTGYVSWLGENVEGAAYGGAAYVDPGGALTLNRVRIAGCVAQQLGLGFAKGGAIYSLGSVEMRWTSISGCSVSAPSLDEMSGGGLFVADGMVLMTNTTRLHGNSASGRGDSIFSIGGVITCRLTGTQPLPRA